jgi:hypothetical protein
MIVADKTLIDSVLSVTPFYVSNKTATKPTKNARFYSGMVKIKLLNSRFSTILAQR